MTKRLARPTPVAILLQSVALIFISVLIRVFSIHRSRLATSIYNRWRQLETVISGLQPRKKKDADPSRFPFDHAPQIQPESLSDPICRHEFYSSSHGLRAHSKLFPLLAIDLFKNLRQSIRNPRDGRSPEKTPPKKSMCQRNHKRMQRQRR